MSTQGQTHKSESTEITQPLVSLAIVNVNWNSLQKDYLENFVSIVAECVRISETDVVSTPVIQKLLTDNFGLSIPRNSINTLLLRVCKQGHIRINNGLYYKVHERLNQLEFRTTRNDVMAIHESIIKDISNFARTRFSLTWNEEQAETALEDFLVENPVWVLKHNRLLQKDLNIRSRQDQSSRYVLGSYVTHLSEMMDQKFDYLETIVKGHMLAGALYLTAPDRERHGFTNTTVYLDTSVLMFALGHAGSERQAPCTEMINLLHETGAKICCFRHTLDEMIGILTACSIMIRKNDLGKAYGPSIEYFLMKGFTSSDIDLFIERLPMEITALGVELKETPDFTHFPSVINEEGLTEYLRGRVRYRNDNAIDRDIASVAAIARLRRKQSYHRYEDCVAIFVTSNSTLARETDKFLYLDRDEYRVPLAITDETLTNLLWLKNPTAAPSLPRKRIIADAYAAMQPPDHFWQKYLTEIDRLVHQGTVTADDYFLLRHSNEVRTLLMNITFGNDDTVFSQGTIAELLEIAREKIKEEGVERLTVELDNEKEQRRKTEEQAAQLKAADEERRLNIHQRAHSWAASTVRVIGGIIFFILALSVYLTFPFHFPPVKSALVRYVLGAFLAILFLFSVSNLFFGTSAKSLLQRLETLLAKQIEARLLGLSR